MTLKDWKKKDKYSYYNKNKQQTIMVYWYAAHPDVTVLFFDAKRRIVAKHLGTFKTKLQALKFAKAYMRKH